MGARVQEALPAEALGGARWNRLAARALAAVRETNPERVVLIGPDDWNHPRGLARLRLPPDRNLIVAEQYGQAIRKARRGGGWGRGSFK